MIFEKKNVYSIVVFLFIYIVLGVLYYPNNYQAEYLSSFALGTLLLSVWVFLSYKRGLSVFEPIFLFMILNFMCFSVDPMTNIVSNQTDLLGYDVMDGAIKANGLVSLFVLFVLITYYSSFSYNRKKRFHFTNNSNSIQRRINNTDIIFSIWLIVFLVSVIDLTKSGVSLSYIFSLGLVGKAEIDKEYSSLLSVIANIRFAMATCSILMISINEKKGLTIMMYLFSFLLFLLRGYRHVLMVMILSPIVFFYIKKRKRIPFFRLISILILIVLVMGLVQFARSGLRSGQSIDWSALDTEVFFSSIKGNFDVYKSFYGMVSKVPNTVNFQNGLETLLSPFIMFVPRRIWPSKPYPPAIQYKEVFCGFYATVGGTAYPYIAEFYLDYGVFGCAIGGILFGYLLKNLKKLIHNSKNDDFSIAFYSVLYAAILQFVLRGYVPGNIPLLLAYSLPYILVTKFGSKSSIKDQRLIQ